MSLGQDPIDPNKEYPADPGFKFRVPVSGKWYWNSGSLANYVGGRPATGDKSTGLVMVTYGSFVAEVVKQKSNQEILSGFRAHFEQDAKSGRSSNAKKSFQEIKFKSADCLRFSSIGNDSGPHGKMDMNYDSMTCLHPQIPGRYIIMAFSERRPLGKPLGQKYEEEKNAFLNSLEFTD